MLDKWLALIDGIKLSKSESLTVKKFKQDPEGKYFLQFAQLLKSHGKSNESLELLLQGVSAHPSFSVARVVLSKLLLEKGLIEESWQNLQESPVSLDSNRLAQTIKIKLATLLGMEDTLKALIFEKSCSNEPEVQRIKQDIINLGFDTARSELISRLHLDPDLILKSYPSSSSKESSFSSNESSLNFSSVEPPRDFNSKPNLNSFRVSNLKNAFLDLSDEDSSNFVASSLSSMTLASIYTSQGHYSKALSIYRKLLESKPYSKVLTAKIKELSKLDKKQKVEDVGIDPVIADKLEYAKVIDYKISVLNSLMSKLNVSSK